MSPKKKIPTNLCTFDFVNKGMEHINVSKIFQNKDVIYSIPFNLQDYQNIPVTKYNLTATTRNKVFFSINKQ